MTGITTLISWQKARIVANEVYQLTAVTKDFTLRDQIRRATISIMNNLAEGYSRRTNKEKCRFYDISVSSCIEVLSMTYLMEDINFSDEKSILELREKVVEVHRLIRALAKSIQNRIETD